MIEAAVFKLRNVLAFLNREKAYEAISQHVPHEMSEIQERIEESGLLEEFERNKLVDSQFFLKIMNLFDPPHSLDFADFYPVWGDVFTTNRGLLKFLPRMKDHISLILMADLSVIEIESFVQHHPEVLNHFGESVIYSSESGNAAPDSSFFMQALDAAGVERKAESVLYIDANLENVNAATQYGMAGHHYVGLMEFFMHLKQLGLLN